MLWATDDVQDVVITKVLFVLNETGQIVLAAGVSDGGSGSSRSKTGKTWSRSGVSEHGGNGEAMVLTNKTGEEIVQLHADEYGNGVICVGPHDPWFQLMFH